MRLFARKEIEAQSNSFVYSGMNNLQHNKFDDTRKVVDLHESDYSWERNVGNSYMQYLVGGGQATEHINTKNSAPKIQRKCSCSDTCNKENDDWRIQTKLKIGSANDVYELEADRVAEQVMRMPEATGQTKSNHTHPGTQIQQISKSDSTGFTVDFNLNQSGGHYLSTTTRNYMEPRFGIDFRDVRLHTDEKAHKIASKIQARAFTNGNNIWLGKGEEATDKKLMAHELAHVVQQQNRIIRLSKSPGYSDGSVKSIKNISSSVPIVQRLTDPLSDMSTFQSPGGSGWRGAIYGCYRNTCGRKHRGWDIHGSSGTSCKAVVAGTTSHYTGDDYGDYVVLTSSSDTTKKYRYAHLSQRDTAGTVAEGVKIGKVGTTGNASSTRPHLHFEVRESGSAVDPDGKSLTKPSKVIEATGTTATTINYSEAEPCTACSM